MKRISKYAILTVVVSAALAAWWISSGKNRRPVPVASADAPLAQMFQPGAGRGFDLAGTDPKRDSTVYTLTNHDSVLKIEVLQHIDPPDAETLLQDGVMGIQALYANALSPYPGDISNKVTTEPAFQPRLFRVTNSPASFTYLLLYANDRFGYGATTKDSVKYKSLVGWFYCSARQEFFKVKLFTSPATTDHDMEATFTSLRCK